MCHYKMLMMSKADADDDFAAKLKNLGISKERIEKKKLNNLGLLFSAREKVLDNLIKFLITDCFQ